MTKMSRTVDREKDVAYLTDFYREKNITNTELFKLLKKVVYCFSNVLHKFFQENISYFAVGSNLPRHSEGLQVS